MKERKKEEEEEEEYKKRKEHSLGGAINIVRVCVKCEGRFHKNTAYARLSGFNRSFRVLGFRVLGFRVLVMRI